MDLSKYASEIDELQNKLRFTRHMAYGAIFIAVLLGLKVVLTSENEKTIVVPPTLTAQFWVHGNAVSPEYVAQMTQWVLQLALTVNPETIDHQKKLYLEYIRPDQQSVLGNAMQEKISVIRRLGAHQVFYPMDVTTKGLYARVSGVLDTYVGDKRIQSANKTYQVAYVVDGRMWVSEIKDITGLKDTTVGWEPGPLANEVTGAAGSPEPAISRGMNPAVAASAPSPGPADVPTDTGPSPSSATAIPAPSISRAAVGSTNSGPGAQAVAQGPLQGSNQNATVATKAPQL